MRVAILGYGSVAAVHARGLKGHAELAAVFGPNREKAEAFARANEITDAETELRAALDRADAAIVCSPSHLHYRQASQALTNGVSCLVELPACASSVEAGELATIARSRQLTVQCAHTSRYLEPYRLLREWIQADSLGEICHVTYVRAILPRARSWADDALLHHAEHPLDLFLDWFGSVQPLGCAAYPDVPGAQDLSLVGSVCGGVPVAVSISYTARLAEVKMTIVGSRHTVATDGFSYIASDDADLTWKGDEQQFYERAVADQDKQFLKACRSGEGGIPWADTIRLTNLVEEFSKLWNRG